MHEFGYSSTFVPAHFAGIRLKFVDGYSASLDYNPTSSRLAMEKIKKLPFTDQVRVFRTGFGMWQGNVRTAAQE